MIVLLAIGFLGGLVTGFSPCIVPVLPVIVAGGATATSRWRPYAIIAGLVASFSVFTLVGGSLLSFLHLPQDLLRDVGIAALLLLALGLLVPKIEQLLEKPFSRLGAKAHAGTGSGFVLGASLGLVFVPCAGPVLAAISVVAATHRVGITSVLLTVSYAAGTAVPLLVLALVARRTATAWTKLRTRTPLIRKFAGAVLGLSALAIALNLTRSLQTSVPGFTSALENHIEGTAAATKRLQALTGEHANRFSPKARDAAASLPELGQAPAFSGVKAWLNTPGNEPLTLGNLRGKVVLVDFWTYSCINCQRTLPHIEAWYRTYGTDGFVVVGVHTPEFDFEHVVSNVKAAATQLRVDYPIAIDNDYATWNAYNNEYWPAEYLIDQRDEVRHTHFGEGDYDTTESAIRMLLAAGGAAHLPAATDLANRTPTEATTPESYLGYDRLQSYVGTPIKRDAAALYRFASQIPSDSLSLSGTWTVRAEEATSGPGARLHLAFTAADVYLVLGGTGTVEVSVNGSHLRTLTVAGTPDLYTLLSGSQVRSGLLELDLSPGVAAYDFTFG